jgi:hypothetical protein
LCSAFGSDEVVEFVDHDVPQAVEDRGDPVTFANEQGFERFRCDEQDAVRVPDQLALLTTGDVAVPSVYGDLARAC